ncbi:MAG: DUF4013 domain-containing protein [Anaerolineae bacterium]|nr:DUF4013 domain-containing protein [Anaerolineae bacterium]
MSSNQAFGKIPAILTFPFRGQGWFGKLAVAALMLLAGSIIPIVPTIILLGYLAEVIRRITVDKEDASLPQWNDWGKYFNDGLKMLGASLVVVVPLILIFIVLFALYFIPIAFIESGNSEDLMAVFIIALFVVQFIMIFVSILVGTLAGLFQPIYMTHMITRGEFSAIFKIKEWWQIFKKSIWEFVVSFLLLGSLYMIVVYAIMLMIYSVVCCCLAPFAGGLLMAYMILVYVALMAYAYRSGAEKLGIPAVPPTPQPEVPAANFELPAAEAQPELPEAVEALPAVETPEPAEPVAAPEATELAVELPEAPVVEPAVEATLVSAVITEAAPAADLPEAPAVDTTLVSQPAATDEVAVVEDLFVEQATVKIDDLKKINGIGPKTAAALNRAGVITYRQLAELPLERLKQILVDAELDVLLSSCDTWSSQAKELI